MKKIERVAIVISGGGSTMEAVLKAKVEGIDVPLIIATRLGIGGIERARALGYTEENGKLVVLRRRDFADENAFGLALIAECERHGVTLLYLMGCLVRIPDVVIRYFRGRVANQHPGGLDTKVAERDFGGDGMWGKRVPAARLKFVYYTKRNPWTHATVHWIAPAAAEGGKPEFDRGVVIGERQFSIPKHLLELPLENLETFKEAVDVVQSRMMPLEHQLQADTLRWLVHSQPEPVDHEPYWLVGQNEGELLARCKAEAIAAFPKG